MQHVSDVQSFSQVFLLDMALRSQALISCILRMRTEQLKSRWRRAGIERFAVGYRYAHPGDEFDEPFEWTNIIEFEFRGRGKFARRH